MHISQDFGLLDQPVDETFQISVLAGRDADGFFLPLHAFRLMWGDESVMGSIDVLENHCWSFQSIMAPDFEVKRPLPINISTELVT